MAEDGENTGLEDYPAVGIMVKYGTALAALVAAVPVAIALWAVFAAGAPAAWIAAGLAAGGLGGLLMKMLAELIVIITDMLLPK